VEIKHRLKLGTRKYWKKERDTFSGYCAINGRKHNAVLLQMRSTQYKSFAIAHSNFCFAKTSFILRILGDILLGGLSKQRKLNWENIQLNKEG